MMIAFLILSHDNPNNVLALTKSLCSPVSSVFIHVDAKSDIASFKCCVQAGAILINERCIVHWGGFSQVRATLALLHHAIKTNKNFTHFALLTGSDYPLATAEFMASFLTKDNLNYIDADIVSEVEDPLTWQRMLKFQLEGGWRGRGAYARIVREINAHILARLPNRDIEAIAGSVSIFRGSAYWILTRSAVDGIVEFEKHYAEIVRMLAYSICPDEVFFSTAVMATSPTSTVGGSVTYSKWFSDGSGPAVVDDEIINTVTAPQFQLTNGGKIRPAFFVRKLPSEAHTIREAFDEYRKSRTYP